VDPVDRLNLGARAVAGRVSAAGAEGHEQTALRMGLPDRRGGDRLVDGRRRRVARHEQRFAVESGLPASRSRRAEVELPEVAKQVARIGHIGRAVAVEVDQARHPEPVAGAGGGGDSEQFALAVEVLDQQHRGAAGRW